MFDQLAARKTLSLDMLSGMPGNRLRLGNGAALTHSHEIEHG